MTVPAYEVTTLLWPAILSLNLARAARVAELVSSLRAVVVNVRAAGGYMSMAQQIELQRAVAVLERNGVEL